MPHPNYILALDQGTTSSRAILLDHSGQIRSTDQKEFKQFYPEPGWVEQDPAEIWESQIVVARNCLLKAGIRASEVAALGITNQRETTVIWDRKTGVPVYPAIVWQDRRTAEFCEALNNQGLSGIIKKKTGLVIDAYFSATKIKWILDNLSGLRIKAERGELCFGTIDSWILWNLSGGKVHYADVSNASRTLLFNIHSLEWDEELLGIFNVPRSILPEVKSSGELFTYTSSDCLGDPVPVTGILGDQQAALFGQLCLDPGMAKNTYGTGCFLVMNTGDKPVVSVKNLITTIAWRRREKTVYALEGSIFIGGAVIQWLRDGLGIINASEESEYLAKSVPDNGGIYFVPALTGLGAPHWDPYARGSIFGISRGTTRAHICRASLESIAFQVYDTVSAMIENSGQLFKELRADGGAVRNDFLMQFQADILGIPVIRPKILETTALGSAYMAGLTTGFWENENELKAKNEAEKIFIPAMSRGDVEKILFHWNKALERSKNWIV